jgi:hypothetical protein
MSKKNKQQTVPCLKLPTVDKPTTVHEQEALEIDSDSQAIRMLKLEPGDVVAIGIDFGEETSHESEITFIERKTEYLQADYPGVKFLIFPLGKVELSVLRKETK